MKRGLLILVAVLLGLILVGCRHPTKNRIAASGNGVGITTPDKGGGDATITNPDGTIPSVAAFTVKEGESKIYLEYDPIIFGWPQYQLVIEEPSVAFTNGRPVIIDGRYYLQVLGIKTGKTFIYFEKQNNPSKGFKYLVTAVEVLPAN